MALLDDARQVMRVQRLALRTEHCYLDWIEQYIHFCKTPAGWRHPRDCGAPDVESFYERVR